MRSGARQWHSTRRDRARLRGACTPGRYVEHRSSQPILPPCHTFRQEDAEDQWPNVLWSHAACANRHIIIRNDHEIVRFSVAGAPSFLEETERFGGNGSTRRHGGTKKTGS